MHDVKPYWQNYIDGRWVDGGAFFEPTILLDLSPEMTIANWTPYGLAGGVSTRDIRRAIRAAQQIRVGQVFVNEWFAGGVETPFGGYGSSG